MPPPRPWVLAELSHHAVRAEPFEVAVVPFGATEPHNLHMPYGTDNFQVEEIGHRACEFAHRRGARLALLPAIPFGVNTNHLDIPGGLTISVVPTTLLKILADIVDSLQRQGIRKIVLLNGHGGNELKPLMRELHHRADVFLCVCDWFRLVSDVRDRIFENPGEHADELETSLGLAFFPDLVDLPRADPGAPIPTTLDAVNRGWISITRPWRLATTNTGLGDPRMATADKGRQLMDILAERIGSFLVDLANQPWHPDFPYEATR